MHTHTRRTRHTHTYARTQIYAHAHTRTVRRDAPLFGCDIRNTHTRPSRTPPRSVATHAILSGDLHRTPTGVHSVPPGPTVCGGDEATLDARAVARRVGGAHIG